MAISGNGTQANPYIVDNWADFLSVLTIEGGIYIKWADNGSKVLTDTIVISSPLNIANGKKHVDFNGWTFQDVRVTIPYSSNTETTCSNEYAVVDGYNLTVDYIEWSDPRLLLGGVQNLYNVFINNLKIGSLPDDDTWWTNGNTNQTGIFNNTSLWNCIIYMRSKNASVIIPRGVFHFCEIHVDYKYTLDNAITPINALFLRGSDYRYCYIGGKIDVASGTGSFDIVRAKDNYELTRDGITSEGSIIDLDTNVSEDCSVYESHIRTWAVNYDDKTFFVTNHGNNYTNYNASIHDLAKGLLSDLRNSDELIREGFAFVEDDYVRYPQYASDNYTKDWTFRKSVNVNTGIPFLPFWKYPTYEPPTPPEGSEVYENPYLTVYDMETKQDNFDNHGLAILCPTSGRVVEELNGEYSLSFTHPRDTDNKWQYVLEMNVVKVLGQLFVIQKVDEVQSGGSGYVTAYAEHITYTLNDKWIFPPVTIAGYQGQALIDSIMQQATDLGYDWQTTYDFDITTDLNAPVGFRDWYEMSEGVTPYEMLIGGNGFVAKIGGELYRDNFHMSINSRMEGARDNAFELAIGYNLTGIKRTVDLTTFCTYLRGYDVSNGDYDNWFAVGWDPSTLPRPYPREVVRSTNFYYEHPEYAEEGQLDRDTMLFFNQNCAPLVSYELNVVDLRRNPDYKMFSNNYRFKVGDKGRVWDERLQAWLELEITRTEHDIITGDCVKVVIGTQRSFTRPVGYQPVISRGIIIPAAERVLEGIPPLHFTTSENKLRDWIIYGASGGVGTLSPNIYPTNMDINSSRWTADGTYLGQPVYKKTAAWGGLASEMYLDVGVYTFSAYVRADDGNASRHIIAIPPNAGETEVFPHADEGCTVTHYETTARNYQFYPNTEWTVYSTTFEVTAAGYAYPRVERGVETGSNTYVCGWQLETGTEVTDWRPKYGEYYIPVTVSTPEYYATGNGDRYVLSDSRYTVGEQTQTVNLVISSPLGEGDSLSKADTGIDIPTFIGDNTLDVGTTVKPRVKIIYKEG